MRRFVSLTTVFLAGMLSTAAAQSQQPAEPKQQTMQEAIAFERHKIASAKAQEAKDAQAASKPESATTQAGARNAESKAKQKAPRREFSRK